MRSVEQLEEMDILTCREDVDDLLDGDVEEWRETVGGASRLLQVRAWRFHDGAELT